MSRFFRQAGDSDSDSESSSSEEELMSSGDEAAAPAAATAAKPMSRFLRAAGEESSDESESESEDESEMSSDEEGGEKPKRSRFLKTGGAQDSSDEDEGKRVVKSAKEKRLEEMEAAGKMMDNALKINDWVAISNGVCSCCCVACASADTCPRVRQARADGAEAAERCRAHPAILHAHAGEPRGVADHGSCEGERVQEKDERQQCPCADRDEAEGQEGHEGV